MTTPVLFLTTATESDLSSLRLMLRSLRTFGGELARAPVWIFTPSPASLACFQDDRTQIRKFAAVLPATKCLFGERVAACAEAEREAPKGTGSLIWIDSGCLVIQPPVLFDLGPNYDAAFRPVHHRNVGLPPQVPLDAFWRGICAAVGLEDIPGTVTSFADGQHLRSYFNTHAFSINPRLGLMQRWYELYTNLAGDGVFQQAACADDLHQVFLFQAVLSTLVSSAIDPRRLLILPPAYNYPYHLQSQIPPARRIQRINDAVCLVHEQADLHPESLIGIDIVEPLRTWLDTNIN